MRFTDYQALSFDCYGTLINWEAGLAAIGRALSGVGVEVPEQPGRRAGGG